MRKNLLLFLLTLSWGMLQAQNNSSKRFQKDENVKKYFSPLLGVKSNAIGVGLSELFVNKSLDIFYQRKINHHFWAEIGFCKGMGEFVISNEEQQVPLLGISRFGKFDKYGLINLTGTVPYIFEDTMVIGNGFRVGLYKSIVGVAPLNTVSYGIQYATKSATYSYSLDSLNNTEVYCKSKMKVNSIMASLIYKTPIYGPIGFDVSWGMGVSFISQNSIDNKFNPLKGAKLTKFDYSIQLRMFLAFLKY